METEVTIGDAKLLQGDCAELWQMMIAQPGARPGLTKPQEPWLAALVYPSAVGYRGDLGWMGDFEACVAWAWITRRPDLSAA